MRKLFYLLCGVIFFAIPAIAQTFTGPVILNKGTPGCNASVQIKGTTFDSIPLMFVISTDTPVAAEVSLFSSINKKLFSFR